MTKYPSKTTSLPSKEELLDFIRNRDGRVGKREVARAFNLKGAEKVALKQMLRDLEASGDIERNRRYLTPPDSLPEITILEIAGTDVDGEMLARPTRWPDDSEPPTIYVAPDRGGRRALRSGDRVLARLRRQGDLYEARVMRRIGQRTATVLGVLRKTSRGLRIEPTDRRNRAEYVVGPADDQRAEAGELVLAEVLPGQRLGLPQARVAERLGDVESPKAFSLIAIHSHAIPERFSNEALALAEKARPATLSKRADLRELPLITIDGPDARDFDDAVWANPDPSPDNEGGWSITVAIADVAHYVRPGDALDRAALERGNSVYFPDRVVPMLPAALSNELCSLNPDQDRACLAAHLTIDSNGRLLRHRFERGLMRSAARLTYEQVQAAHDGKPEPGLDAFVGPLLRPLYGAFKVLGKARRHRGALELDLAERRAILDDRGRVSQIVSVPRYDSHRLIEEFMIAANIAAAETLERLNQPCMYRVHAEPDAAKVEALREFAKGIGLSLAAGQNLHPRLFNRLLEKAKSTPHAEVISELVLRCQSQAVYSPHNIGHFGLSLRRYAHFTSPIRRYSDLLVHRALIRGQELGDDGLRDDAGSGFEKVAEQISITERRAAAAERDTLDRYISAYLTAREGAAFDGRITGVTRFGIFVRLADIGADGLVPMRFLPGGPYRHDVHQHALTTKTGQPAYRLGDLVEIRIVESNPVKGATILELLGRPGRPPGSRDRKT